MAPATPEENYKMFFAIIECSGNTVIDWNAVGKITEMKKGSVYMRYIRLKKSMETEIASGIEQPRPSSGGSKRKAANEDNAEPKKRKVNVASGGSSKEDEEETVKTEERGS